jgi:hypothetical protein
MRLVMPRWLLFLEGVLLMGALVVLAYKAATRVLPLPAESIRQLRMTQKRPVQPTILDYYRMYPDRYIRVENEIWKFDRDTKVASHSFSLRNLATVAYSDIEIRISYEAADGKVVLTRDIKIQGVLNAQETREFKGMKVTAVPESTKNALITLTKGRMVG